MRFNENKWKEVRLKDIFLLGRGKFTHRPRNDPKMYGGEYPFLQTGDVAKATKYITTYKQTLNEKGILVSKKFKKDTILMTISANIGDIGVLKFSAYFPDSIIAFNCSRKINNSFAFYFLKIMKNELNKIKITNTQDNLNLARLDTIIKYLPPLKTQQKIATYLDTQTEKIDKEINLLEQKIEKYKELKQTLINETVLRGLDKGVELKDSGVEWIGEIPEGWKLIRFEDILHKKKKKNNPLLDCGSISFGKVVLKDNSKIPIETKESYQEVLVDEFLINPLNLNFDLKSLRTAISTLNVVVSSGYIVLQGKDNTHKNYLRWLLHQFDVLQMKTLSAGVRHTIHYYDIAKSLLYMPSINEQTQIATYLDEKTQKIDNITKTISKKIELLKEFRKTLVNDVVTGKIKVDRDEI